MLPTLKEGQDVLVFNWAYLLKKPKVGEIVVIKVNGKELVKRIQSLNDRSINVVGDNSKDSLDSRKLGSIIRKDIIGKVVYFG